MSARSPPTGVVKRAAVLFGADDGEHAPLRRISRYEALACTVRFGNGSSHRLRFHPQSRDGEFKKAKEDAYPEDTPVVKKKKEKKINPRFAHLYTKEEGGTAETKEEAEANQRKEEEVKLKAKQAKKEKKEEVTLPADKQETEPRDEANQTFVEATRAGLEQAKLE